MKKISNQAYTTEFKELKSKCVTKGNSIATVIMEFGMACSMSRKGIVGAK